MLSGIIFVKHRQYPRFRQKSEIATGDTSGLAATTNEVEDSEACGTLTPFILPSLTSQLHTPLTKLAAPRVQPHSLDESMWTQNRGIGRRDGSEGRDTLVQVVQRLQERVASLEGRSSDTFGNEGAVDPPPTYAS
jgi:hypothetical protein